MTHESRVADVLKEDRWNLLVLDLLIIAAISRALGSVLAETPWGAPRT